MIINKLNVYIQFAQKEELVGQLVLNKTDVLFKYADSYLENGFNLSPLKIKD